jgi:hypothetical protein
MFQAGAKKIYIEHAESVGFCVEEMSQTFCSLDSKNTIRYNDF